MSKKNTTVNSVKPTITPELNQAQVASLGAKAKSSGVLTIFLLLLILIIGIYGWGQSWWSLSATPSSVETPSPQVQDNLSVGTLSEGVILTDVSGVVDLVKPSIVTVSIKTTQLKSDSLTAVDPWSLMFCLPGQGLGQL